MKNKIEIGKYFAITTRESKAGDKEVVIQNDQNERVVIKGEVIKFYHALQKEIKDNF